MDAGRFQPSGPVFPVVDVDERKLQHVGRFGKATSTRQQFWTAHGE
jgi:hypothetical protein